MTILQVNGVEFQMRSFFLRLNLIYSLKKGRPNQSDIAEYGRPLIGVLRFYVFGVALLRYALVIILLFFIGRYL